MNSGRSSLVLALATLPLLVSACSDDGIAPIEDPPDASGEPNAPDVSPEEPEEPEDTGPEIFQGQLYPPLPDLEPDPRGGDEETQREIFEVHTELYEIVEQGLSTNVVDENRLRELAAPEFVEPLLSEIEGQEAAGRVSVSADSQLGWVQASVLEADEAIVLNCVENGPETGGYEIDTGEPAGVAGEEATLLRTFTYERDTQGWQVGAYNVTESEEACDALPQA